MAFINISMVLLCATGDPMTPDHHYSHHLSHYVSPRPVVEPGLIVCQANILATQPPGGCFVNTNEQCKYKGSHAFSVEPARSFLNTSGVTSARCLITFYKGTSMMRFLNPSGFPNPSK